MIKEKLFNILMNKYKQDVYSFCRYTLRDATDAEDATQEVFVKTWNNMGSFNPAKAKSWIIKTAYNHCIDVIRKRKSSYDYEIGYDPEVLSEIGISDDNMEIDEMIDQQQVEKDIKSKIELLPQNLRSVFVLYEIQGMKYREISKSLDLPINTVKVYLMRARKSLRESLRVQYETN